MTVTLENGFITQRDENGVIEHAIRVSEVALVKRGDYREWVGKHRNELVSVKRTSVRTQLGAGYDFRCDVEHMWALLGEHAQANVVRT